MSAATAAAADLTSYCDRLAATAATAGRRLRRTTRAQRTAALHRAAERLVEASQEIQAENARDLAAGKEAGLSSAMLDRLRLDDKRIAAMAQSVREIAEQRDPVGEVVEGYVRPNGLKIEKTRVPIGVILIIFESRPNVTSDAAALCIKSGNGVILRGGKEARYSNAAIAACMHGALEDTGLDPDAVQLVETTDRAIVPLLLKMEGRIDLCIPRGGHALIRTVVENAHIPVIKHDAGICHVYVDDVCDPKMAVDICYNAKVQKPSVCNAVETILLHRETLDNGLARQICEKLAGAGVEIRGDDALRKVFPQAKAASEEDWATEYLELIVSVRVVDAIDEAIDHINTWGSAHTDAIVTDRVASADRFLSDVDAANVFVNCSTRFADGGEYGLGAEIGISTDKMHARGPMGASDLTTYKWIVRGSGQVRG